MEKLAITEALADWVSMARDAGAEKVDGVDGAKS